jgi:hypothetical protein
MLGFTPLTGFALQIHGSQCEVVGPDSLQNIAKRDQFGISIGVPQNMGAAGNGKVDVRCPFTIPDDKSRLTSAWLVVQAYDRHPVIDVSCTLSVVDSSGNLFGSDTRGTTGNAAERKIFQVGGPIDVGANLTSKYTYVTCSIPQSYNGQRSHITAITLNLVK